VTELALVAVVAAGIAIVGMVLGLALAPRIGRLIEENEEDVPDEGGSE